MQFEVPSLAAGFIDCSMVTDIQFRVKYKNAMFDLRGERKEDVALNSTANDRTVGAGAPLTLPRGVAIADDHQIYLTSAYHKW